MLMVVEVEGYCGLCYDMLRITFRFHVFDILMFGVFFCILQILFDRQPIFRELVLVYMEFYVIVTWCCNLERSSANSMR